MIQHHPDDDLLLDFAAGTLESGPALVVDAHVERCARCRGRVSLFESVGGALLDELEPALLAPEALAHTLARIDAESPARPPASAPTAGLRPALPEGLDWPRSLQRCGIGRWRWLGPGVRWSRVSLPYDRAANVFLLRIAAGRQLPTHTHTDWELTQVLFGAFHDGRALFGPGDFDETDTSIQHQPVVQAASECICLASVKGRLVFKGGAARLLGSLVGI